MAEEDAKPKGPDLSKGVALASFPESGMLTGHVGEDEVLLVHRDGEVFAVSAHCTHYHGPLADGLVVDGTVRCPWHHACFDLSTGKALHAPAFDPLGRWKVEQRDGMVFVGSGYVGLRNGGPGNILPAFAPSFSETASGI